jgi:resolvase-like protein
MADGALLQERKMNFRVAWSGFALCNPLISLVWPCNVLQNGHGKERSRLHDKGVDLFLRQQGLDTSTTAGKAMFQMLGVFAEFERGIIRERVNAGLARARASGVKLGRRRVKPS